MRETAQGNHAKEGTTIALVFSEHDEDAYWEDEAWAFATYRVFGQSISTIEKTARSFAIGQTIGTWVPVPGITREMKERYAGRVVSIRQEESAPDEFLVCVAFPCAGFADSFAMMLTALVGNDVSTAMQARLVDLSFTNAALASFTGPKKGIDALRRITGITGRPLVLNMIKPCAGFSADVGARLFYQVALGGMDLIKDDELLGNPGYNRLADRVSAYLIAAKEAYEITGKYTVYMPNITDTPRRMWDNAKAVLEAGAKTCMVNFVATGLDVFREVCNRFGDELFIMGHYAGVGTLAGKHCGIANRVAIGLLPRLAGADAVMTMAPRADDENALRDFVQTSQTQNGLLEGIKATVTACGGGITPANQQRFQKILGQDSIIGIGGSVQGHPMGTKAGALAAVAAVKATAAGMPLEEAARHNESLRASLEAWPDS